MEPQDPVLIAFLDSAREALAETAGGVAERVTRSGLNALAIGIFGGLTIVLFRRFRRFYRAHPEAVQNEGAGLRVFHALFALCFLLGLLLGEDVARAEATVAVMLGLLAAIGLVLVAVRATGRAVERLVARVKSWREGKRLPLPLRTEPLARELARTLRRALLPPVLTVAIIIAAVVAWLTLGNGLARRACSDALRRVTSGARTSKVVEEPRSVSSSTALRLEEVTRGLGLDLAPLPRRGPALDPERAEEFRRIAAPLREHLARRNRRPDDEFPRAPEAIRDFLFVHRAALSEVTRLLSEAAPPSWEYRPEGGFEAPVPPYMALLHLSRILVADGYEAAGEGDFARANSALAASDALAQGLSVRSERFSQVFAMLMLNAEMGLLRRLDPVPPGWERRLLDYEFRARLARAATIDAERFARFGLNACPGLQPKPTAAGRAAAALALPLVRFSVASSALRLSTAIPAAMDLGFDALAARARSSGLDPGYPTWDIFGRAAWGNIGTTLRRLARFELDRDLTVTILRLRAGPPSVTDAPRAGSSQVDGAIASISRGKSWVYMYRDGHLVDVHLDSPWLVPADDYALALPVRYVGHRGVKRLPR